VVPTWLAQSEALRPPGTRNPRVAPTSRLARPLRNQGRPRIGRADRDVARAPEAHTWKTMCAPPPASSCSIDCEGDFRGGNRSKTGMNPLLAYSTSPLKLRLPSGRSVSLRACFRLFKAWQGTPVKRTHGRKTVVDLKGQPLFAELAILRLIRANGWGGVWIDNWGRKFRRSLPPHSCDLPPQARDFLDKANQGRKWRRGCFDVLAWNEGRYLFIEAKRKGKDRIRKSQLAWLESALAARIPVEAFLVFEWGTADKS